MGMTLSLDRVKELLKLDEDSLQNTQSKNSPITTLNHLPKKLQDLGQDDIYIEDEKGNSSGLFIEAKKNDSDKYLIAILQAYTITGALHSKKKRPKDNANEVLNRLLNVDFSNVDEKYIQRLPLPEKVIDGWKKEKHFLGFSWENITDIREKIVQYKSISRWYLEQAISSDGFMIDQLLSGHTPFQHLLGFGLDDILKDETNTKKKDNTFDWKNFFKVCLAVKANSKDEDTFFFDNSLEELRGASEKEPHRSFFIQAKKNIHSVFGSLQTKLKDKNVEHKLNSNISKLTKAYKTIEYFLFFAVYFSNPKTECSDKKLSYPLYDLFNGASELLEWRKELLKYCVINPKDLCKFCIGELDFQKDNNEVYGYNYNNILINLLSELNFYIESTNELSKEDRKNIEDILLALYEKKYALIVQQPKLIKNYIEKIDIKDFKDQPRLAHLYLLSLEAYQQYPKEKEKLFFSALENLNGKRISPQKSEHYQTLMKNYLKHKISQDQIDIHKIFSLLDRYRYTENSESYQLTKAGQSVFKQIAPSLDKKNLAIGVVSLLPFHGINDILNDNSKTTLAQAFQKDTKNFFTIWKDTLETNSKDNESQQDDLDFSRYSVNNNQKKPKTQLKFSKFYQEVCGEDALNQLLYTAYVNQQTKKNEDKDKLDKLDKLDELDELDEIILKENKDKTSSNNIENFLVNALHFQVNNLSKKNDNNLVHVKYIFGEFFYKLGFNQNKKEKAFPIFNKIIEKDCEIFTKSEQVLAAFIQLASQKSISENLKNKLKEHFTEKWEDCFEVWQEIKKSTSQDTNAAPWKTYYPTLGQQKFSDFYKAVLGENALKELLIETLTAVSKKEPNLDPLSQKYREDLLKNIEYETFKKYLGQIDDEKKQRARIIHVFLEKTKNYTNQEDDKLLNSLKTLCQQYKEEIYPSRKNDDGKDDEGKDEDNLFGGLFNSNQDENPVDDGKNPNEELRDDDDDLTDTENVRDVEEPKALLDNILGRLQEDRERSNTIQEIQNPKDLCDLEKFGNDKEKHLELLYKLVTCENLDGVKNFDLFDNILSYLPMAYRTLKQFKNDERTHLIVTKWAQLANEKLEKSENKTNQPQDQTGTTDSEISMQTQSSDIDHSQSQSSFILFKHRNDATAKDKAASLKLFRKMDLRIPKRVFEEIKTEHKKAWTDNNSFKKFIYPILRFFGKFDREYRLNKKKEYDGHKIMVNKVNIFQPRKTYTFSQARHKAGYFV